MQFSKMYIYVYSPNLVIVDFTQHTLYAINKPSAT